MSKTVVVLGGGIAGIATAHKLLKHTLPKLPGLKVVLVSASTHFYFNIAAVRGLIPGEIPDESLFQAIEPGFAKYPKGSFEFVVGTATALDLAGNAVQVSAAGGQDRTLVYDQLVIATGSSLANDVPFKTLGSYDETIQAWHKLQDQIKAAKSIVVAGAGPTGVETIGELANKYGTSKKLTLVIDGEVALPALLPSVGKAAESELKKMKVELLHKVRVTGVEDAGSEGTKLSLSDGKTLTADVFLPLYGVRPNTGFVPAHLLDAAGSVKVDKTLRVEGQTNVWAVGDVNNVELKVAMRAESQTVHLFPNLEAALLGKGDAALAEYKPSAQMMMFVTIGKKKGTGQIGTFKAFSFLVSYMKGRTLFVEKAPPLVAGKSMIRAAI
ncbi:FAD/NAD(P)-binding domain-containing protein [Coniochaeta ligniaria NRRL 30616]|uniref:FAD/NAD(P)-binding domain-containing protein n=1 Tax=Coniochaeta ligniaria NRRL 30616 TaxID=1408157 RepID=A0A1J7IZF5_9PEZI|nr:FAD/NAD(P)-binding domain-containing protein [Coniochaeta ligniaria NRRL 30616]